ncbi:MAG: SDR family oxidoreductase [Bacteroidetes bacterium]|nr:SDR family oxidoreductase [Bacteroidota bacterium]
MKSVLITGANKGIGFETARQLARQGYFVYLGSRNKDKGLKAVEQLKQSGISNVEFVELDVAVAATIKNARQIIESKKSSLDVLINNAGISGGLDRQGASTAPTEVLKEVFDTNFFGAIQVTQEFLPLLKKSKAPRIVNVTSDLASSTLQSDPGWKYALYKNAGYNPSKSALNAYTIALAVELKGSNFKVNCVSPGYTATDFTFNQGQPVEQGAAVIAQYAMLDESGPTGKFINDEGELPW